MKTIAYQGILGSFSYLTAIKEFGLNHHFLGVKSFRSLFESILSGQADYGVIPIENSLIGSIYENYDLLNCFEAKIVAEHFTKITHCLLSVPLKEINQEECLKKIKKVFSHPKAIEQCSSFFQEHPWIEAIVYQDTASAAEMVSKNGNPKCAAIASAEAGKIYGLDCLKIGIENDPKNYTRFIIITKRDFQYSDVDKCSLLMKLKHAPGTLKHVLEFFAQSKINLTKIESRPNRGSPFEYVFYLDFEFKGHKVLQVQEILNTLEKEVQYLKVLGFYKAGFLWNA